MNERVLHALQGVRLENFAERYPHQLSGGQQQRVAFARAIVIEPKCILFDEPLSTLDAILREEMGTELKVLVDQLKTTAVFVTHDQIEAMSMSDVILVLNKGRVEQEGTPEEIYNTPSTHFVAHFVGRSNWLGSNRMFRPESLMLTPEEGTTEYQMSVKSMQFVGNGYELCLERDTELWYALSPRKFFGKSINVYVKDDKVLQFSK